MTHNIKIKLQYADAIIDGRKTFEVRKNDRGYNAGDKVKFDVISDDDEFALCHYPLHPLNNAIYEITYVHSGLGLEKDYVVFGLKTIEEEKESLSKQIEKISGSIRNDDTKTIAVAVNVNADVLTEVVERLEKLEQNSYLKRCEEAAERI